MRATLDSLWAQVKEFFSGLSARERRRFLLLGAMIVVLSVVAAWLLGRESYAVVWTGLDPAAAGTRTAAITELGIKYKLEDGGATILVPADKANEVRNSLAASGITDSGFNYDLYGNASGLGMTAEDRKIWFQWQQADILKTYYKELNIVEDASVIINLGAQSSYILGQASPATATIMITTRDDAMLTQTEATAIISTATGAIDGLTAENVTLTDRVGRVYSISGTGMVEIEEEKTEELSIVQQLALEAQVKADIERQVHNLFIPIAGAGNLTAMVTARLDFDKEITEEIIFAPPVDGELDGIAVSIYELWQTGSNEDYVGGVPGTDSNGMGTVEYPYLDLGENEYLRQYVREANYEINQTIRNIEKAQGGISDLSVGIIVNSNVVSAEYTDAMADVAAKALGIDAKRVSVQAVPFQELPVPEPVTLMNNPRTWEIIMFAIKALVVLLLGLSVIAFLRGLFMPKREPEPQLVMAEGPITAAGGIDYVAAGDGDEELLSLALADASELAQPEGDVQSEHMPSLADMEKAAKPESIIQLENFIDRDPAAVAQLLRNWLSED